MQINFPLEMAVAEVTNTKDRWVTGYGALQFCPKQAQSFLKKATAKMNEVVAGSNTIGESSGGIFGASIAAADKPVDENANIFSSDSCSNSSSSDEKEDRAEEEERRQQRKVKRSQGRQVERRRKAKVRSLRCRTNRGWTSN